MTTKRTTSNARLHGAKRKKNGEFYTQLSDIEEELCHYAEAFRGKTVLCNCDDPRVSNFFRYFCLNFEHFGLKRVITTCYKNQNPNLFSTNTAERACYLIYDGNNGGNMPDWDKVEVLPLKGDGSFDSKECVELLEQSDIVVTNPPFSLFREYVAQLIKYDKKFLIIGNINAITYKEIFKLIKDNKAWLGINLGRGISGFIVPEHYELYGTETRIDNSGNRIISPNNCLWLTNLETFQRNEDIILTKKYIGHEKEYPKYDNCNGINVNKTQDIPMDYAGLMGVPITFLHK